MPSVIPVLSAILAGSILLWVAIFLVVGRRTRRRRGAKPSAHAPIVAASDLVERWRVEGPR
jgi:hypothetical protein